MILSVIEKGAPYPSVNGEFTPKDGGTKYRVLAEGLKLGAIVPGPTQEADVRYICDVARRMNAVAQKCELVPMDYETWHEAVYNTDSTYQLPGWQEL